MEIGITVFSQIIKMFIMMMVGFVLYKKEMIDDEAVAKFSNVLLMVATPCTLVVSFYQEFSMEKFTGLMMCFALSFLIHFVNVFVAKLFYRKEEGYLERFSLVFSNTGFFGIPLVTGLFGIEAVFYLSPFIVVFYLFVWTYGVVEMSRDKSLVTVKKIATNPCIWAVIAGFALFMLPITLPLPMIEAVEMLGNMNTPLAMLVLGAYMAKEKIGELLKDIRVYRVSLLRLIVFPILYCGILTLIPTSTQIRLITLMAASAPVAVIGPIFAQMFQKDVGYGARIVCLSTLFSAITLPVLLTLAQLLWA